MTFRAIFPRRGGGAKWQFSNFKMHFWGFGVPGLGRDRTIATRLQPIPPTFATERSLTSGHLKIDLPRHTPNPFAYIFVRSCASSRQHSRETLWMINIEIFSFRGRIRGHLRVHPSNDFVSACTGEFMGKPLHVLALLNNQYNANTERCVFEHKRPELKPWPREKPPNCKKQSQCAFLTLAFYYARP